MNVQQIAKADIVMDKPNPDDRTFSREFCENLARSIESDGLLYEPIVRPIPDQPGKVRPITGRNRIYACGKILGWEHIPCKIAPDGLSDEEAMAMQCAENLWRLSLDDAQTKKALIRWQRIYDVKHPAAGGKGAAAKQAKIVRERIAEAEAKGEKVDPEQVAAEVAAENKPFSKVLQETTKMSPATAGRLARITKNLTPDQVDVLAKHKVTDHVTEQLAGLGDRELIVKAINLIASGMDHMEAVRQAGKMKHDAKQREDKGPLTKEQKEVVPKPGKVVPAAKPKDKELTDEEWLNMHCEVILKNLRRKAPFKRDAILYRRISEQLIKFRGTCKKPLAEAKNVDGNGGFFGSLARVVRAAHPRDWLVCGGCNGQGDVLAPDKEGKEAKQTCTQCHGAAYRLKLED